MKLSDWLKIRNGCGILTHSAWQGLIPVDASEKLLDESLTYRLMESVGLGGPRWHGSSWQRRIAENGSSWLSTLMTDIPGDLMWDLPCMQQASNHWCGCCPCTYRLIKNLMMMMMMSSKQCNPDQTSILQHSTLFVRPVSSNTLRKCGIQSNFNPFQSEKPEKPEKDNGKTVQNVASDQGLHCLH